MKCDVDGQGRRIPRLSELRKILKENLVVMYYHNLNDWEKEVKTLEAEIVKLRSALKEVSGCHKNDKTPKLCMGCLLTIAKALEPE
jgi:hypothetical protein